MKLYHGTNGRWLDSILRNGLRPRGQNPTRNNWKHVAHQSNPRCVYLTDSYAPYFAFNASRGKEPLCAVIEIDIDHLDPVDLFPDEDFLEQASRQIDDPVPGTMSERTLHYCARQFEYNYPCQYGAPTWWEASLKHLGTVAHRGPIPAAAITQAVVWPHTGHNLRLAFVWDPSISLANQQFCGDRYRALTAKLFAGEFTDPALTTMEAQLAAAIDPAHAILPTIEGWRLIDNSHARAQEAA